MAVNADLASDRATESTPLLHDARDHNDDHTVDTEPSVANDNKTQDENHIEEVSLRTEVSILLKYSGPLVVTYFLQYAYQVIIIVVAAQLSTEEIAGVSLGITTANITGFAVFEGMATALDTLCSQAYGSSRLAEVGLYTIRATILVHLVAVIPIGTLWLFSGPIIAAIVPSNALAIHASSFLRYTLIGVPGFVTFENGKRFMQAQGDFTAGLVILVICLPINIGLTYLLVYVADMRVAGAALSASLTNFVRPLLLAIYAKYVKPSTLKCWPSASEISAEWRNEWGRILRLAIPGTMMTLSEWLCFEILTFATAYVSDAALAAQTFLGTTATLVWHIPFSASVACSTRVGQLVGAGMTASTGLVMKWYAVVFLIAGLFDALIGTGFMFLTLRYLIHDAEVAHIVKRALPYAAMFMVFDATANWPHSIGRGFGWQDIGAWCTMTINYLYAVPLSIFLELGAPHMGISGLWIGLGTALFLTTVIEAFAIWRRLVKTTDGRIVQDLSEEDQA